MVINVTELTNAAELLSVAAEANTAEAADATDATKATETVDATEFLMSEATDATDTADAAKATDALLTKAVDAIEAAKATKVLLTVATIATVAADTTDAAEATNASLAVSTVRGRTGAADVEVTERSGKTTADSSNTTETGVSELGLIVDASAEAREASSTDGVSGASRLDWSVRSGDTVRCSWCGGSLRSEGASRGIGCVRAVRSAGSVGTSRGVR